METKERKFYSSELKKEIGEYGAKNGKLEAAIKFGCSPSTVKRAIVLYYRNTPNIESGQLTITPRAPELTKPNNQFNFNQLLEQKVRKIVKEELTKFFGL